MSRIRNLIKGDGNGGDLPQGRVEPAMAGDANGPLPWLESAPDDFDDDSLEDEPLIPRRWLAIGGLLFLTLLAGVVYAIYRRSSGQPITGTVAVAESPGVDDPRIPMIEAPKTPVREKPANPGGMQVADTDKQVYDVVDGQVTEEPTHLAQAAETPVERPAPPVTGSDIDTGPDMSTAEPPKTILPKIEPVKPPVAKAEPIKPPVVQAEPIQPKPAPKPKPVEKPIIKPEPPKPEPAPVIAAAPASGSVYVQLGAFSSRERAEAAWSGLAGKGGLSGLSSNIQQAGPTKFRLRAGPIASRSQAEEVCAKLSAAGQACLIAK